VKENTNPLSTLPSNEQRTPAQGTRITTYLLRQGIAAYRDPSGFLSVVAARYP
jgi:hypothetical protein